MEAITTPDNSPVSNEVCITCTTEDALAKLQKARDEQTELHKKLEEIGRALDLSPSMLVTLLLLSEAKRKTWLRGFVACEQDTHEAYINSTIDKLKSEAFPLVIPKELKKTTTKRLRTKATTPRTPKQPVLDENGVPVPQPPRKKRKVAPKKGEAVAVPESPVVLVTPTQMEH